MRNLGPQGKLVALDLGHEVTQMLNLGPRGRVNLSVPGEVETQPSSSGNTDGGMDICGLGCLWHCHEIGYSHYITRVQ